MWGLQKTWPLLVSIVLVCSVYVWGLSSIEWSKRKYLIQDFWEKFGVIVTALFAILSLLGLPFGILLNRFERGKGGKTRKRLVEVWVLFWTFINILLVAFLIERYPLLAVVPVIRLFDLLYIFFYAFLVHQKPEPPERALVLLLVHYLEVITSFGAIYLALQSAYGGLFTKKLSGVGALYFSFVTGSTIGFGDVVLSPWTVHGETLTWPKIAVAAVALEILCLLAIVLLEIPRVLTYKMAPNNEAICRYEPRNEVPQAH